MSQNEVVSDIALDTLRATNLENRNNRPTAPPPPMPEAADELLEQADRLRVVAARILARAGELVEVAEEMRRAS